MKPAFLLALVFAVVGYAIAPGQIPPRMSYQGVLTDDAGNPVPDQSYSIEFRIYDAETGGVPLWSETQSVPVVNGVVNAILGSGNPLVLAFDKTYWLGVSVSGGTELTPRKELASVAYSLNAKTVEDGAITADKIANGHVVRSLNGMTDDVGLVGGSNVTVTQVGNDIQISAGGGSLTLPFSGDVNDNGTGFSVTNNGAGDAVRGSSEGGVGVYGETNSSAGFANAMHGVVLSTTPGSFSAAVRGENRGTGGFGIGVYGSQAGSGWGVFGTSEGGAGVRASSVSGDGLWGSSGSGAGVSGTSESGPGVQGEIEGAFSNATAVRGAILSASPGGGSAAVRGENQGTSGNGIGVWGSQDGSGWGVYGTVQTGRGVFGRSISTSGAGVGVLGETESDAGVGVRAKGASANGTALEIEDGAIKVTGAGVGTNTAVFIHEATAANIEGGGNATRIEHPLTNGDPNAILIVTNHGVAEGETQLQTVGFSVAYHPSDQRWRIYFPLSSDILVGDKFNILIVKP